jgi:N-acyl homoserine lactone hydrolase
LASRIRLAALAAVLATAPLMGQAGHAAETPSATARPRFATIGPAPAVTSPRLYVIDCGFLLNPRPEAYGVTMAEVANPNLAVTCHLIVHPKGMLLFDTGLDDRLVGRHPLEIGLGQIKLNTLASQLATMNVRPEMVDYVVTSHSHFDHTGNAAQFPDSTWITNPAEYELVKKVVSGEIRSNVFNPRLLAPLLSNKVRIVEGDHDVFGDGTVVLLQTPGHTPGHMSLYVKLANTGGVVLVGDLYHLPEERTLGRMPAAEQAAGLTQASRDKLEAFAKARGAQVWISHSLALFRDSLKAPAWYD